MVSCPKRGSSSFTLAFYAFATFEGRNRRFKYSVSIETGTHTHISHESLSFTGGPFIFDAKPGNLHSGDLRVEYNNFAQGGRKPTEFVTSNRSVLSQYSEISGANNRKNKSCKRLVSSIMSHLNRSFVFDPNPKNMRGYERIGNTSLNREGSNLSAVLYGLKEGAKEDREALDRLLGWIQQLPEEPFEDFDFVTTTLGDVILAFSDGSENPPIDARMLSDGTLRCLAVLTALETVDKRSRVVIEEFDNGLHPSRVRILLEAIDDCCRRKDLNVLVTTHNPASLDSLKAEQLDSVTVCAKQDSQNSFKLLQLNELPRFDELLERERLGNLVTTRTLDRYFSGHLEEERMRKSVEWIEGLNS